MATFFTYSTYLSGYHFQPVMAAERAIRRSPSGFLSPQNESGQAVDQSESGVRAIELAEAIINFETIPGFEYVKGNLLRKVTEDEMAAMYLGKMLKLHGRRFSFVPESDQTGTERHDMQVSFASSDLAIEVKCKRDTTSMSSKTIVNSVRSSQLPAAGPGVFVFGMPLSWTKNESWIPVFGEAAERFFNGGRNRRVNAIFALGFRRFPTGLSPAATVRFTKIFTNPTPAIALPELDDQLFTPGVRLPLHGDASWQTIAGLIR